MRPGAGDRPRLGGGSAGRLCITPIYIYIPSVSLPYIPSVFLLCTLNIISIHSVSSVASLGLSRRLFVLSVFSLYPVCILSVSSLCPLCVLSVSSRYPQALYTGSCVLAPLCWLLCTDSYVWLLCTGSKIYWLQYTGSYWLLSCVLCTGSCVLAPVCWLLCTGCCILAPVCWLLCASPCVLAPVY